MPGALILAEETVPGTFILNPNRCLAPPVCPRSSVAGVPVMLARRSPIPWANHLYPLLLRHVLRLCSISGKNGGCLANNSGEFPKIPKNFPGDEPDATSIAFAEIFVQ